jgi:hypothetical protein
MRRLLRFLGWIGRQPEDMPPFPFGASERLWAWLTKPADCYPMPPYPTDENARGTGWSGQERTRPFAPRAPLRSDAGQDIVTVNENIQHRRTWDEPGTD